MRRTARGIAGCLLVLTVASCASIRAAKVRRERLQAELDALRYPQPSAEVWQQVRSLLADRGYDLAGADAAAVGQKGSWLGGVFSAARETHPYGSDRNVLQALGITAPPQARTDGSVSLDTGWRENEDRYHADGLVEADGFRVVFTHVVREQDRSDEQASRDLDLELALAKRVDPAAAARIEAAVNAR